MAIDRLALSAWRLTHKPTVVAIVIGMAVCVTACREAAPAAATASSRAAVATPAPNPNSWARERECGADAQRVGAEIERRYQSDDNFRVDGWENHYNRRDDRCYIMYTAFATKASQRKEYKIPLMEIFVDDVFEHRTLVTYTNQRLAPDDQGIWCSAVAAGERSPNATSCNAARRVADDLMTK